MNDITKAIILLLTLISLFYLLIKSIWKLLCLIVSFLIGLGRTIYKEYLYIKLALEEKSLEDRSREIVEYYRDLLCDLFTRKKTHPDINIPTWDELVAGERLRSMQSSLLSANPMGRYVNNDPRPLWEIQLQQQLKPVLEKNYEFTQIIVSLPQGWQRDYSVRQLKRFCTEINRIFPRTIVGHASKRTNKRALIGKIQKLTK